MRKIPKNLTVPSSGWVESVGMKRAIAVLRCEASNLTQAGCVLEAHALRAVVTALVKSIARPDAVPEAVTLGWDTTEQWHGPTGGQNMTKAVWHSGPPPSIGWWPARFGPGRDPEPPPWPRWWNGARWSVPVDAASSASDAAHWAGVPTSLGRYVQWIDRPASWPTRSRT